MYESVDLRSIPDISYAREILKCQGIYEVLNWIQKDFVEPEALPI